MQAKQCAKHTHHFVLPTVKYHYRSDEAVEKEALGTDRAAATEHPEEQEGADEVEAEQDTDRQLPVNTLFYGVRGQQVGLSSVAYALCCHVLTSLVQGTAVPY